VHSGQKREGIREGRSLLGLKGSSQGESSFGSGLVSFDRVPYIYLERTQLQGRGGRWR